MSTLINRRRYTGAQEQEKVLFELYNQYFDGTANSVIDTGLKLWDGTHNRWKMEVVYDQITPARQNITLFTCKPDVTPYSGIRVRSGQSNYFELIVSETTTIMENTGGFSLLSNTYGDNYRKNATLEINTFTIIRNDNILSWDYNGSTAKIQMSNVKTNNLDFLIGCDYKGSDNQTQRYYTGTIQKFVITKFTDMT